MFVGLAVLSGLNVPIIHYEEVCFMLPCMIRRRQKRLALTIREVIIRFPLLGSYRDSQGIICPYVATHSDHLILGNCRDFPLTTIFGLQIIICTMSSALMQI